MYDMYIMDDITPDDTRADLGGGCRECAPPPPPSEMTGRLSNTTGILQKKICAPLPKKNPGSAPMTNYIT